MGSGPKGRQTLLVSSSTVLAALSGHCSEDSGSPPGAGGVCAKLGPPAAKMLLASTPQGPACGGSVEFQARH